MNWRQFFDCLEFNDDFVIDYNVQSVFANCLSLVQNRIDSLADMWNVSMV